MLNFPEVFTYIQEIVLFDLTHPIFFIHKNFFYAKTPMHFYITSPIFDPSVNHIMYDSVPGLLTGRTISPKDLLGV